MTFPDRLLPPERAGDVTWVPAVTVRIALGLVGTALTLLLHSDGWAAIGIVASVIATLAPAYLTGWFLILFLAASELGHPASLHWQFPVLLAGLHLLHLLSALAVELPWRAWIQPRVLLAPLRRFALIQVPSQGVAVLILILLAPDAAGRRPADVAALAVVGALALAGLAVLLLGTVAGREDPGPG